MWKSRESESRGRGLLSPTRDRSPSPTGARHHGSGRRRPAPAARTAIPILIALLLTSLACTSSAPKPKTRPGYQEKGTASWYGPGFHGKTTANGEVYDMDRLTAAHKTLPVDTMVEVRNRDNGRTVRVRINDRGPFVRGRIIDLSRAAAEAIDMIGPGTAPVIIRVVKAPDRGPDPASKSYLVQAGAFHDEERADELSKQLSHSHSRVEVQSDGTWYRVLLGPFEDRKRAEKLVRELARQGIAALVKIAP